MSETKKTVKIQHTNQSRFMGIGLGGISVGLPLFTNTKSVLEIFNFFSDPVNTIIATGFALATATLAGMYISRGVASTDANNVEIVEKSENDGKRPSINPS